jgi:hypothetical protein
VSGDLDPFWLAMVTKVYEKTLEVAYFHHGPLKPGKKLIWKPYHSNGTCGRYDVQDWKSPKHLNKLFSLYLEFNFTLILVTTLNFYCCPFNSNFAGN